MTFDKYSFLSGRLEDVKKLCRIVRKKVNVLVSGNEKVGKSYVSRCAKEALVNVKSSDVKVISVKAQGNKQDYEQIGYVMSTKYKDICDDSGNVQSFAELSKGSVQVLGRRIISGIKNSDKPYLIFIEELKKLPESMKIFLSSLLRTKNVSIVVEAKDLSNAKTRKFYEGFDKFVVSPVSDSRMSPVYDELIKDGSVKIDEDDYSEIKKKLISETKGNIGRLKEIIDRSTKERSLKKEDILEKFVNVFREEYSIGNMMAFLVVFALAYRYYLRGTSEITGIVVGGFVMALAILFYRISSKFK